MPLTIIIVASKIAITERNETNCKSIYKRIFSVLNILKMSFKEKDKNKNNSIERKPTSAGHFVRRINNFLDHRAVGMLLVHLCPLMTGDLSQLGELLCSGNRKTLTRCKL